MKHQVRLRWWWTSLTEEWRWTGWFIFWQTEWMFWFRQHMIHQLIIEESMHKLYITSIHLIEGRHIHMNRHTRRKQSNMQKQHFRNSGREDILYREDNMYIVGFLGNSYISPVKFMHSKRAFNPIWGCRMIVTCTQNIMAFWFPPISHHMFEQGVVSLYTYCKQ